MDTGIYAINIYLEDLHAGIYLGSAEDLPSRWAQHKRDLDRNRHHNVNLQGMYNLGGRLEFSTLRTCWVEELNYFENVFLDWFSYSDKLLNVSLSSTCPVWWHAYNRDTGRWVRALGTRDLAEKTGLRVEQIRGASYNGGLAGRLWALVPSLPGGRRPHCALPIPRRVFAIHADGSWEQYASPYDATKAMPATNTTTIPSILNRGRVRFGRIWVRLGPGQHPQTGPQRLSASSGRI